MGQWGGSWNQARRKMSDVPRKRYHEAQMNATRRCFLRIRKAVSYNAPVFPLPSVRRLQEKEYGA